MNASDRQRGIRFCLAWLLICGIIAPPARAFDAIHAFGDSLTDTGNEPAPVAGYFQGRYSNGQLWIEYLSPQLGFGYNAANNLARSGTETSDALAQVRNFPAPTNAASALFVIWSGGNDFIHNFSQGLNDAFWNSLIPQSVSNISNAVEILYADGARTILVPNLVDLSRIPLALDSGLPSLALTYLRGKVNQFDSSLASALASIAQAHSDLQLIRPDVYTQFNSLLGNLVANGFTKADPDALTDPQLIDKSFTGPGADYVFWDPIHPTTKAHALIAQWFLSALPAPQPRLSIVTGGGGFQLTLGDLQSGQVYTLQTSSNLVEWSDSTTVTATNTAQPWAVSSGGSPVMFFRIKH